MLVVGLHYSLGGEKNFVFNHEMVGFKKLKTSLVLHVRSTVSVIINLTTLERLSESFS